MEKSKKPKKIPEPFYKEMIKGEAKKGTLNFCSSLSTPHEISCKECKHSQKIVYLEYLKSGEFEFGRTTLIFYPDYWMMGVLRLAEPSTPIMIKAKCEKCDYEACHAVPVNLEYLLVMITREQRPRYMYV